MFVETEYEAVITVKEIFPEKTAFYTKLKLLIKQLEQKLWMERLY